MDADCQLFVLLQHVELSVSVVLTSSQGPYSGWLSLETLEHLGLRSGSESTKDLYSAQFSIVPIIPSLFIKHLVMRHLVCQLYPNL